MKKILLAALLTASATAANAQDNVIKVNILSPIVRTGSFFFEHKLSAASSFQVGGLFTKFSLGSGDDKTGFSGFAITPEYRFYLSSSKEALEGFYVGPYVRYQNLTLKSTYSDYDSSGDPYTAKGEATLNTFGGGILIGHQWIFKQRFSLDTFLGPSYNSGTVKVKMGSNSGSFDPGPFDGFGIRTGVTFGLAF